MLVNFSGSEIIANITRTVASVRVLDDLWLFDDYLASNGEYSSLLSDAVAGLVSTQAHGRIDIC